MSSAVSDHFLYRLKAATRDLVKLVGGVVRAGEITSHSKTTVSRWQSVTDPDVIDLCAAIALEVEALEITLKDVTQPYGAVSGKTPDHAP